MHFCDAYISNEMEKIMKTQKNYIVAAVLWLIFIVYTILVMKVDVQPIGPEGSSVGLAGLNQSINGHLPYNDTLHTITGITGYLALFLAACVGFVGVLRFVKTTDHLFLMQQKDWRPLTRHHIHFLP